MSIVITVIIFGLIISAHEAGHFIAARIGGVPVLEFAVGMGPKLFSFTRGETMYSLRLIPIGGYCKMLGEDEYDDDPRAFCNRPVHRRVAVAAGGSIMNFVMAFLIFLIVVAMTGMYLPQIRELLPGMPAEAAGFLPGDRIVKVNGTKVNIYEDFRTAMADNGGRAAEITLRRNRESVTKTITPVYSVESGGYLVGFRPDAKTGLFGASEPEYERAGVLETLHTAFYDIAFWIKYTFISLTRLVTGRASVDDLAGPIGVAQAIGVTYEETKSYGLSVTMITMANIMALISANLGVFNLLPLPALDGGRLVFLALEGVRKKPLARDREGMVHLAGFVALMVLAVFIAVNDIRKFM